MHEYLSYCRKTGELRWKKSPANRTKVGDLAGYDHHSGYRILEFKGCIYQVHRLVWWMIYGVMPNEEIDHINGIRNDNRICNLRDASRSQNQHNRKTWKNGTISGLKGSFFHKATGKWASTIQHNKKRTHLGLFETAEEAHEAYLTAAKKLHGEFARP